ncbi:MAG: tyrosine--tRNA ligase [Minisyncoccales bacterium]|jgi:tyrosyl-tRNA synthetase
MKNREEEIKTVLVRGVDTILPSSKGLKNIITSGKKINIYCGYDPTAPTLHLGHLFTILKLADFQSLGHKVIMLIGDFTGMIGDPTDKSETRRKLNREEVILNSSNYKKIAQKFIKFSGPNPAKLMYNSSWGDKLSFTDIIELASNFTVQQMLVRDMFQERIKRKKPIYLHEFLYPLAQGYDSVAMDIDLEVGGKDQLFNMLCGRDLVKILLKKEKFVLGTKLLVDSSGKKMGKTEGPMVALDAAPEMIYGKIMSWTDEMIIPGLEGCTRISMDQIRKMDKEIRSGKRNPFEVKSILAKEVTRICHNDKAAEAAEKEFNRVFREKEVPSNIKEVKIKEKSQRLIDLLAQTKIVSSKNEGRRIISQRGVKVDGVVKTNWEESIPIKKGMILNVGKRRFVKIV